LSEKAVVSELCKLQGKKLLKVCEHECIICCEIRGYIVYYR
jgi:hypothetical protein